MNGGTERHRNYCFTSFNCVLYLTVSERWDELKESGLDYIVYQKEISPKTNKEHIQGYLEFNRPLGLKKVKKILKDDIIHLEARRGSQKEAIEYCKKEDTRFPGSVFYEFGKKKNMGHRTDLDNINEIILNGGTLNDIANEFPSQFIRYGRGIKDLWNMRFAESIPNFKDVETIVLWGDAGTGKTKSVYESFNPNDVYRLKRSNGGNLWFDGYIGQKVLLIDEFYGWITWSDLLEFTDGYKIRLDIKGGHTYKAWDKIIITSNKHPSEWYRDFNCMNKPEFCRRISRITKFEYNDRNDVPKKPLEQIIRVSKDKDRKLIYSEPEDISNENEINVPDIDDIDTLN